MTVAVLERVTNIFIYLLTYLFVHDAAKLHTVLNTSRHAGNKTETFRLRQASFAGMTRNGQANSSNLDMTLLASDPAVVLTTFRCVVESHR